MRTVGPVSIINEKTYGAESLITLGYAVQHGVADGNATAITAAGQRALGIASLDITSLALTAALPVVRFGDARAIAGAAVPYGAYVIADAVGRLVPAAGVAGEEIVGRAESTASGLGDEFLVFVHPIHG